MIELVHEGAERAYLDALPKATQCTIPNSANQILADSLALHIIYRSCVHVCLPVNFSKYSIVNQDPPLD